MKYPFVGLETLGEVVKACGELKNKCAIFGWEVDIRVSPSQPKKSLKQSTPKPPIKA